MPTNNPNDNNMKAWKNFYKMANNLKEGTYRQNTHVKTPSCKNTPTKAYLWSTIVDDKTIPFELIYP